MERTRCDEQDVVRLDHPVLRVDGRAFHQRQQIALHALTRHLAATVFTAAGDLVDLVEEHDAVLLDVGDGLVLELLFVQQLGRLFVDQQLERLGHLHLATMLLALAQPSEHRADLLGHVFHARRAHDVHAGGAGRHFELDLLVVELAFTQLLAKRLARVGILLFRLREANIARRRDQHVEQAIFRSVFGLGAHLLHLGFARLLDSHLGQVTHDGVDVAADVTDFGELGRFDLDEGRIRQLGQTTGDLGLAHAGRSDHQDVLGRDFLAQRVTHLLTAPAVAQGHGHGFLGLLLADDVLVEFGDDFRRRHGFRHGNPVQSETAYSSVSITKLVLV